MVDSKFFVEHIDANANTAAQAIRDASTLEEREKFARLEKELAELEAQNAKKAQIDATQIASAGHAKAKLDAANVILSAKKQALDAAISAARERILNRTDNVYSEWIGKLIAAHAQSGDTVVAAKADTKRITRSFIEKLSAKLKISLSLSDKTHRGVGGILLQNSGYDKNLSLDALLESLQEEFESDILQMLFAK